MTRHEPTTLQHQHHQEVVILTADGQLTTNEPPQLRGERPALVLADGARRPPRTRLHPVLGGRRSLFEGLHHPHVNRQRRRERSRAEGQSVEYWKVSLPEAAAPSKLTAKKRPDLHMVCGCTAEASCGTQPGAVPASILVSSISLWRKHADKSTCVRSGTSGRWGLGWRP
jgi:hypothetical protein